MLAGDAGAFEPQAHRGARSRELGAPSAPSELHALSDRVRLDDAYPQAAVGSLDGGCSIGCREEIARYADARLARGHSDLRAVSAQPSSIEETAGLKHDLVVAALELARVEQLDATAKLRPTVVRGNAEQHQVRLTAEHVRAVTELVP